MSRWAASARARWLYHAHWLLQKLSGGRAGLRVYLICAQPVGTPALANLRDHANTRVVAVGPGDPLLQHFPRPTDVLTRRFASGAVCHAVLVKGEFAGHIWLASGYYDEDEVRCRYVLPSAATAWDFDVYVEPRFRGTRVIARLWKGVDQALRDRGVLWSYSRISLYNAGSIQAHEQLAARYLCTGIFLTIGGLQAAWFTRPLRLKLTLGTRGTPVQAMPMPPGELPHHVQTSAGDSLGSTNLGRQMSPPPRRLD